MNDALKMFLIALVTAVAVQLLLGPYIMRLQGIGPGAAPTMAGPVEATKTVAPAPAPAKLSAPNLEGMTVADARARFGGQGLRIIEDDERIDPAAKPGTILQQRPGAGAELSGNEIRVTVAKAAAETQVPNTIGMSLESARELLVQNGFEVPDPAQEASEEPAGTVIKQTPNPGAVSKAGAMVRLVISQVPAIEVPKVTSKHLRSARKELEKAGLRVGNVRRVEHEELGQNIVLRQTPAAGETVPPGTEIDLVVVAPN